MTNDPVDPGKSRDRFPAEAGPIQAHERYRTVYQQTPSILFVKNATGTIVDVNEFGAEYLGYTPRELIGSPVGSLAHPDDRAAYLAHLEQCVREPGVARKLAVRMLRKDGQILWLGETARAVVNTDGETLLLCAHDDITQRVAVEGELRQAEEQLRNIAENLREVLWVADPAFSRITYLNPAYEDVWGRSRDLAYQDPRQILEAVDPADRSRVELAVARMAQENFTIEFRIRRPTSEARDISCRGFPVRRDDGTVVRIVGIAEDVTERKRLQQRNAFLVAAGGILASSFDYEDTLRSLAQMAVVDLADWCVIDIKQLAGIRRVAFAYSDPSLAGVFRDYEQRYPPDAAVPFGSAKAILSGQSELIPRISEEMLQVGITDPAQLDLLRGLRIASAMFVPLKVDHRILGAITLIRFPSARSFDEEDLHMAELLASQAALAVDKAELYKQAQEATKLREEVLTVVSHDLRNPLNNIMLSADVVEDTEFGKEPRLAKQVDIIRRAAGQMTELIGDLLDVSQIEAGSMPLNLDRHSGRLIALEACHSFRTLADDKAIKLTCNVPRDLPPLRIDRGRLLQVFSNLIGNAVKFTDHGGRIEVSARATANSIRFEVMDNGVGIEPDDLPRLFDRFYQSNKTKKGGAGLGLAIAKGIVEAHSGRIEVFSTPGVGSTFSFELPTDPASG